MNKKDLKELLFELNKIYTHNITKLTTQLASIVTY